jgi:hypothetical protein
MSQLARPLAFRLIIHIDLDAFYASVGQPDAPHLRGVPIAVERSRERRVVAAESYEARRFGVHTTMPSVIARRLCPDLIFVQPRFDVYKAVFAKVWTTLPARCLPWALTSSNRLPIHDRPHVMVIDGHSWAGSHRPQRRDDCYLMAKGPPV